ncbi:MAG: ABC transporter ATP-binding protein [Coriobacteriia bacterium]|nr:ABC transporter ATP-binding protein [Coriobacteriia bacterium]
MPDTDVIVEMRHITKRFPGIVANDDISLQIHTGEIFAFAGENGAGKSTLMSMLFGMYQPDEGEIWVRGKRVDISSPNEAVALGISMVHQHFKLVRNYTVAENIVLGIEPVTRLLGLIPYVNMRPVNKAVRELSERYGLEVDPTSVIEDLPVSTQQRVEILKMLYREAEILIFDEPTAMLTPQEISYLLDIIRKLREDGKTIILITHKLEEIKQVADRCAILNHGKLIATMDVATSSTRDMASKMVGREVIFEIDKTPARPGPVVLEVSDLTVENEHGVDVTQDVSFQIHAGEIFAIAGVAGSGQVELADAVAGLSPVKTGAVLLEGRDITRMLVRPRTLKGVSYIPEDRQDVGLILDFLLEDNLASKSYFKAPFSQHSILHKDAFDAYADDLIRRYDIRCSSGALTLTRSMSGGNQQKAIVAREVEQDARLMIFVQPTRGLDIGAILAIRRRMIEERDKGRAILLVSLELDEILAVADTIGVMFAGRMLKVAPADQMTREEVGEYMMGVKHA